MVRRMIERLSYIVWVIQWEWQDAWAEFMTGKSTEEAASDTWREP